MEKLLLVRLPRQLPARQALLEYTMQPVCTALEMQDAEQHIVLKLKSSRPDGKPPPILILDDFDHDSDGSKNFARDLAGDVKQLESLLLS